MSVTAARELLEVLCKIHNVPVFTLHDFDKWGFSILGTLHQDTRRYSFRHRIKVIDLGLRLEDIGGLQSEKVHIDKGAAENLRENGAKEKEIAYLLKGRRVELNAMTSDQLVAFIERKLKKHGVAKVIPDPDTLADAYRRMRRQAVVQDAINEALEELGEEDEDIARPRQAQSYHRETPQGSPRKDLG